MDSCEYIPIAMIEAYALPLITKAAGYKPNEEEDKRGSDFFPKIGDPEEDEAVQSYGFNYVKLAYEVLYVAAIIKPKFLYYGEETKDSSRFAHEFKIISKSLKEPPEKLAFFKESPENLRKRFQ